MSKQKIAKYQKYLAEIEKLSDEQVQELSQEMFRRDDIPKESIKRRINVLRQAEDFRFRGSEISKLDSFFERIGSAGGESGRAVATSPKSLVSSGAGSESDSEAATRSALSPLLSERSSDLEGGEDEERDGPFTAEDIDEVMKLTDEGIERLSREVMGSVVDKGTFLGYLEGEHDLEELSKVRSFISNSKVRARTQLSEEEKRLKDFDDDKAKLSRVKIEVSASDTRLPEGFLEEFGPLVEKYSAHEGTRSVVFKGGKLSGDKKFHDRARDTESSKAVEDAMLEMHQCVWKYVTLYERGSSEWKALIMISKTLEGLRPELCNQENAITIMDSVDLIEKSMKLGAADSVAMMDVLAAGKGRRSEGSAFGGDGKRDESHGGDDDHKRGRRSGRARGRRTGEDGADAVPGEVEAEAKDIGRKALSSISANTKLKPLAKKEHKKDRMRGEDCREDLDGADAVPGKVVTGARGVGGGGRKGRKRG